MKCAPPVAGMPLVIQPKGLDPKRQWYFYQEIRQFVPETFQEIVAPLPNVPTPRTVTAENDSETSDDNDDDTASPPPKCGRGRGRGQIRCRGRPKKLQL